MKVENIIDLTEKKPDYLAKDNATKGLPMLFYRKYVAVDITSTEVRVLSVQRNQVIKWGSAPLREGLIKDGVIIEPQDLSLILEDLFTSLDLPRKRVICTITGLPFTYRTIAMPDIGEVIDQEAIQRVTRKEMSITEPDMFIFWKAIERHPEKKETDYFIVAVPKVAVRPLANALEKAHIDLYELDIKPLALARLASTQNAIMISMEKKQADIVIVARGQAKTLYSFPLVDTTGDRDSIVSEVVNGLDKTLKSHNHDYPDSPLPDEAPFLVSGDLANDPEILKKLSETSGHSVMSFESPFILPQDLQPATCAANLGLALKKATLQPKVASARAAQYKDININLLTSFIKKGIRISVPQVAAALTAIVLLGLIYYAYDLRQDAGLRLKLLNTENDAAGVQLMVLQKENKDSLTMQTTGSESIQKLKVEYDALTGVQQYINNAKVNCTSDIKMVKQALMQDASFQTINIDKSLITVSGEAEDAMAVLEIADWLDADNRVSEARVVSIQPAPNSVSFSLSIKK